MVRDDAGERHRQVVAQRLVGELELRRVARGECPLQPLAPVQDAVEQNDLSMDLYKMLDELPPAYRSVLTLIDINELDYVEAAKALKVPIGTVKSRLARARMQMKKKLQSCFKVPANFTGGNAYCAV